MQALEGTERNWGQNIAIVNKLMLVRTRVAECWQVLNVRKGSVKKTLPDASSECDVVASGKWYSKYSNSVDLSFIPVAQRHFKEQKQKVHHDPLRFVLYTM